MRQKKKSTKREDRKNKGLNKKGSCPFSEVKVSGSREKEKSVTLQRRAGRY